MKHISTLFIAALSLTAIPSVANAEIIDLSTPSTSMILDANVGSPLRILYYGDKLTESDINSLFSSPLAHHDAYPVYGIYPQGEAALSVTHADGNRTTQMEVTGVKTKNEGNATVTTVAMRDKAYPFEVNVNNRVSPDYDVIETFVD
ncbi:MAG: alpha-galactosidase, partial [Muribaculum sp.]|nr:alpha-galactosidase [Muribaculum sp.]